MRRFMLDLWYRIQSPLFWVSVAIGALGFTLVNTHIEGFGWPGDSLVMLYERAFEMGTMEFIVPCIAVLPNIKRMVGFRGELMKYDLMRTSARKRLLSEMASSAVSGGLALVIGPLLVTLVLSLFWPVMTESTAEFMELYVYDGVANTSFADLLRSQQYILYFVAKFSLLMLFGITVNMISFAFSTWIDDSFIIAFIPMILLKSIENWSGYLYLLEEVPLELHRLLGTRIYITGFAWSLPYNNTYGFWLRLFGIECAVWLLGWAVAQWKMNRRLRHG